MAKDVVFIIDGFNVYHSLIDPRFLNKYKKYKWLNYAALASAFYKKERIKDIYYCTAIVPWDTTKAKRHKTYIKALETEGVKPIYGKFKRKTSKCRKCKQDYSTFEEKQTDVNIAILLLKLAFFDHFTTAVIISADSDLIPAIHSVQTLFPDKNIHFIFPPGRNSDELKNKADLHSKIKERHLSSCQFPEKVTTGAGVSISKPSKW